MDKQAENLSRVSIRISESIINFCAENDTFYAEDLRNYVENEVGQVAPGSADRILRDLRQRGKLNYRVLSRSQSYYEVIPCSPSLT